MKSTILAHPREEELLALAQAAFDAAYAPYSKFRVGAAVLTESGGVFSGCNVENASFGGTICAERNAIAAAVCGGHTRIVVCAIVTAHTHPASPCGFCRQVLREFSEDALVVSKTTDGQSRRWTLSELLPDAFGPDDLGVGGGSE